MVNRRTFLASSMSAVASAHFARSAEKQGRRILLRSSWQTVNIGDIAHTPGMLTLLEKHRPNDEVTLWPNLLESYPLHIDTGGCCILLPRRIPHTSYVG